VTGLIHDAAGSYLPAFAMSAAVSALAAFAIWRAAPGAVRAVPGRSGTVSG
jgi:cyanate permease